MVIALLLLLLAPAIAQDQEKSSKPPGRGDTVIAKGCLRGTVLENAALSKDPDTQPFGELFSYRLTGDKKTLEMVRKEHDGHVDILTAELKTDLPSSQARGRTIGKSRITIGVGGSRGMTPEAPPPIPVLRVTALEHTGVTCR